MNPMSSKIFGRELSADEDILQCIELIINTPKGALPTMPEFGCNAYLYLDLPIKEAIPKIIKEISDSIALYEKRATIESIVYEQSELSGWYVTINYRAVSGKANQYNYNIFKRVPKNKVDNFFFFEGGSPLLEWLTCDNSDGTCDDATGTCDQALIEITD